MYRITGTIATLLLLLAACGDDDGGILSDMADHDDTEAIDPGDFDDDFDDDFGADDMWDDSDGPGTGWDGPVVLELDFEELREVVSEAFLGEDAGRGSARWGTYAEVFVDVREGELTTEEILAGCEELTDWIFAQPEDVAHGPVVIEVSELDTTTGTAGDEVLVVVNEDLVAGEDRGGCRPV